MPAPKDKNDDLQNLIQSYGRFVPHEFLGFLGKKDISGIRLGDQVEKNLTVLFSDIRGFTTLSEELTPQQNFNFINSYLSVMEPVILEYDGIIDKYVGDAIMALFPTSADAAVQCGIAMLEKLAEYNENRKRSGYVPIKIGIGLNTGLLMLGIIGGERRMESTVIGDAANLASRIESMTKTYGVPFLISEHTFYDLKNPEKLDIRFLDRVIIRGKTQPQSVYEVFAMDPPEIREKKKANQRIFEEALAHYHFMHVETAREILQHCLETNPEDIPVQIYLERCDTYLKGGEHTSTGEFDLSVEWTAEFEFGMPIIDEQHRELFEQSSKLLKAIFEGRQSKEVGKVMTFLDSYVVRHFSDEEKLMEKYSYPFTGFQISQHRKFSHNFKKLESEIKKLDASNHHYILFRTQLLLVDWLVKHTLRIDKHLGRFIRRAEAGLGNEQDTNIFS